MLVRYAAEFNQMKVNNRLCRSMMSVLNWHLLLGDAGGIFSLSKWEPPCFIMFTLAQTPEYYI